MRGKGRLPFLAALRAGLPGWPMAIGGALAWGAALLASAALTLFLRGWAPADMPPPLMIFFLGGATAFPLALWLAGILDHWLGFRRGQRFAAVFVLLGVGSVALTALIFSQVFRHYFAEFHAPFASRQWVVETVFTTAAAVYHFLVNGLRLFVPLGLPALAATAFVLARRPKLSNPPPGANSTHPQEPPKDRYSR